MNGIHSTGFRFSGHLNLRFDHGLRHLQRSCHGIRIIGLTLGSRPGFRQEGTHRFGIFIFRPQLLQPERYGRFGRIRPFRNRATGGNCSTCPTPLRPGLFPVPVSDRYARFGQIPDSGNPPASCSSAGTDG